MGVLNRPAYAVEKDRLIYDSSHPIDAIVVQVSITADEDGEIKRGQLIDYANGVYSIHAEGGEANAIVAENVGYKVGDKEVPVAVYISGPFRASEIITEPELTAADAEALRGKGIYLK